MGTPDKVTLGSAELIKHSNVVRLPAVPEIHHVEEEDTPFGRGAHSSLRTRKSVYCQRWQPRCPSARTRDALRSQPQIFQGLKGDEEKESFQNSRILVSRTRMRARGVARRVGLTRRACDQPLPRGLDVTRCQDPRSAYASAMGFSFVFP